MMRWLLSTESTSSHFVAVSKVLVVLVHYVLDTLLSVIYFILSLFTGMLVSEMGQAEFGLFPFIFLNS